MQGIEACGDTFTSTNDTGADCYLCWGWPQAEQVAKDNGGQHHKIVCVDSHPFALMAGNETGARILQLGNWGALATYPSWLDADHNRPQTPADCSTPGGPVLVLGQVYTAEQQRQGLVDVWHTHGYEAWARKECASENRKFRKHPRVWAMENDGEKQPTLIEDLLGCSAAASWNSTAATHAQILGWRATAAEPHGWASMELSRLRALQALPSQLREGAAWLHYREWLLSEGLQASLARDQSLRLIRSA